MITQFNDDEDMALQGLPPSTQVMYLRGIRRFMDYRTGVAGLKRGISYKSLSETCHHEINRQMQEAPTKNAVRAAIKQLERAGIIERIGPEDQLVFKCILADKNKSVQINNDTTTTQQRHSNNDTREATEINAFNDNNDTTTTQQRHSNNDIHQITDNCYLSVDKSTEGKSVDENVVSIGIKRKTTPPYQEIVEAYHEILPTLAQVYKLTEARKTHIKSLWADELDDLDSWKNYFAHIARSDFLMGRSRPSHDGRLFVADFDFIIKPSNFVKIAEEKYHGKKIQR